jgi:hypothetical protein
VILIVALAFRLLAAAAEAPPQVKLLCVSQQTLKGEATVGSCPAKGENSRWSINTAWCAF